MAIQTGLLKSQMTGGGLYGPQTLGLFTPQSGEGLGLPNGQVSFNLPRTSPAPGTSVNFPGGQVPGFSFSVTRTASSDPVKNIINDIQNPLNSTNINFKPAQQQEQAQNLTTAPPLPTFGSIAPPGQMPHAPFTPTLGRPGTPVSDLIGPQNALNQYFANNPQFSLRSRMLTGATQGLFPLPFI